MTTLTPEEIKALKRANVYTYYDENAGHSTLTVDEFIGKLTGNADTATRFKDPCILSLTGDASGMVQIYGSEYKDLNVTVTHADEANHAQRADVATLTNRCSLADIANLANFSLLTHSAEVANRSLVADNAITANDATHADSADTAISASRATYDASGNAIDTTFASHNDRISSNATKNTQQDLRLDDLENYTELKEWKATTTYKKDKVVVYEDNLYRSKANNNLNHLPTEQNSAYWKLLSETASGGTADCVHINNTETVLGDKTFTGLLIATTQEQSDNSTKVATTSFVHSAVNTLATNVYSKTETNNLVTPKADNDSVVHLADAETITGIKTFSNGALLTMPQNPTANDIVNKDYVDNHAGYIPNQIIISPVPMGDANLHLLDGSVLTSGVYAGYVAMMIRLYNADPTATCWTTETAWQNSVTTYGECGKFVVDTVNNTVRLPKLTSFIQATSTASELGSLTEAGVPNITGEIIFNGNRNNLDRIIGAFYGYNSSINWAGASPESASSKPTNVVLDASRSSPVYGKSNTVQPQSVKYYYYIVVGTVSKTPVQVDIDNIATDLNGKADRSLSNVDNTANILMAHNAMPSTRVVSFTVGTNAQTYTAPADGYVMLYCQVKPNDFCHLTSANGSAVLFSFADNVTSSPQAQACYIPISKGYTFQIDWRADKPKFHISQFVYAQGAVSEA